MLICCVNALYTQNLVPNGSFEDYSVCPYQQGQLGFAKHWFSPTENTPDYFNACASNYFNVPNAGSGYQEAFDGTAYVGLFFMEQNNTAFEYIAVKLTTSLEKDRVYCISYQVSLAEQDSYCVLEKIGLYLSKDSIFQNGTGFLHYTPQIRNNEPLTDPTIWYEVSGLYTAAGGEQFLYIGNFDSTENQIICNSLDLGIRMYAYVDYVNVTETSTCGISLNVELPNVITPNNNGTNDMIDIPTESTEVQTLVYSRWGSLVSKFEGNKVYWDGKCNEQECSDGVYYMIVRYKVNEQLKIKQTFIHLFNH